MVEFGDQADFVAEVLHRLAVDQRGMRDLQRHADPLDRVHRLKDGGKATYPQPLFDPVLSQLLANSQISGIQANHGCKAREPRPDGRLSEAASSFTAAEPDASGGSK